MSLAAMAMKSKRFKRDIVGAECEGIEKPKIMPGAVCGRRVVHRKEAGVGSAGHQWRIIGNIAFPSPASAVAN